MRTRIAFTLLLTLALAAVAAAQTKIAGTSHCGKPDQALKVAIGDRPNHAFAIFQGKCTWTNPLEIAGTKFKEDLVSATEELHGNRTHGRGYVVNTTDSGDKTFVRTQGSGTLKDGMTESAEGKWTFLGGTGKLKGIKGSGTYKGKAGADGIDYEIEGEYELPQK